MIAALLGGLAGLVVGLVMGVALLHLLSPRARSRRLKPVKSKWRLHVGAAEVLVRTGRFDEPYEWEVAERWRFDPTDVDSRADALAKAEDYLAGLRDVEQRAREISGR